MDQIIKSIVKKYIVKQDAKDKSEIAKTKSITKIIYYVFPRRSKK
jgi:hypothetical protein